MKHPWQHHDGLPPRRPPAEKGFRFRALGAGALLAVASMGPRFLGQTPVAWPGVALVLLALFLCGVVLVANTFTCPAEWHGHAYSFAIGILVGMPIAMILTSIVYQANHPKPFVNPYVTPTPKPVRSSPAPKP